MSAFQDASLTIGHFKEERGQHPILVPRAVLAEVPYDPPASSVQKDATEGPVEHCMVAKSFS